MAKAARSLIRLLLLLRLRVEGLKGKVFWEAVKLYYFLSYRLLLLLLIEVLEI